MPVGTTSPRASGENSKAISINLYGWPPNRKTHLFAVMSAFLLPPLALKEG